MPESAIARRHFPYTAHVGDAGITLRLMSAVTMTSEMAGLCEVFGWGFADLEWLTLNAMKSAFCPFDQRLALINTVIKPRYDALTAEAARASAGGRA